MSRDRPAPRTAKGDARPEPGLFEVIDTQRSLRRFRPEPLPEETIRRLLEAARKAPSPTNCQPWAFIVVRDPARRRALADIYARAWGLAKQFYGDPAKARDEAERVMLEETDRLAGRLDEAPVLVNCCLDRSRLGPIVTPDLATILEPSVAYGCVWAAVQNLLLAAHGLGLAAVPTNLTRLLDHEVRPLLGMPDHVETVCLVALGYPARPARTPPRRRPLAEVAHDEIFGRPLS
jgi:nitroreductase